MKPQPLPILPGQESVWDYPRPPRLEQSSKRVQIWLGGVQIIDTRRSYRVLETSHPPVYYLPPEDFAAGVVSPAPGVSVCEFKGAARYWSLSAGGQEARAVAWSYPEPLPGFEAIRGYLAVYPGRVDRCTVDGVTVLPQPGNFYGGWITPEVVGPFKGEPGTQGW